MSLARISRRGALLAAGSGIVSWGRLYAAGGEFWDKKPPSEWDSEQIDRLLHKSPWAKEVKAELIPGESDYGSARGPGGGSPRGGGGGVGYPGGGGGMGGPRIGIGIPGIGGIPMPGSGGGRRGGSYEKGTVRWESAQPLIDAQKTPLTEEFAGHYVVSVSGIPIRDLTPDDSIEHLKRLAILDPRGGDIVEARMVRRGTSAYSSFLFGFSRKDLTLTTADREVLFSVRLGVHMVRAKFEPKEMQYRKQLAV